MQYWLVKTEPETYSWATLVKERRTAWTGVRNFQARRNLQSMKKGDVVLVYHSGSEKQVVGIGRVEREAYADPTATEGDWVCVELSASKELKQPVTLEAVKKDPDLKGILLAKNPRLSVQPLAREAFEQIVKMGGSVP